MIIDLSGVAPLEYETACEFIRVIDGIYMMGCKTILTGLRAEIVNLMQKVEFKGTLQLALNDVFFKGQKSI